MKSVMCVDCDKEVFTDSHSTIFELVDGEFIYHSCEVEKNEEK